MHIDIEPGMYVLAVSGGVDSMVLLHILAKLVHDTAEQSDTKIQVVVAHFDHGIRSDSQADRELVAATAARYGLPFVYDMGNLGPRASEAAARTARYTFLHRVRMASQARAIITAHHQDDMLETAILNMLRGTGRRGLTALRSRDRLVRPLLHVNKQHLLDYANQHKLHWHEDSTNDDDRYTRNYVRRHVLGRFTTRQKLELLALLERAKLLNHHIDTALAAQLHQQPAVDRLDRHWFIALPHAVAREVMATWLRERGIPQFDTKAIERLVASAKTYQPNKYADITSKHVLHIGSRYLTLQPRKAQK